MRQILGQQLTSRFSTKGITPNNIPSLKTSKVHDEYSINGSPSLANLPKPSQLDLDGKIPNPTYIQNPPN